MKEIMVIKDEQAIDEWNRTIAQFIDVDNKIYKAEFIKEPETFADFQEICEKVIDKSKHDFEAHKGFTLIDSYQFRDDGSVWLYYENVDIITNISIFQMWLILKGIFGV